MSFSQYSKTRFVKDHNREIVWKIFAPHLQGKFSVQGSVLDIGCGYGSFINNISCKEKFAIDLDPAMKQHLNQDIQFFSGPTTSLKNHLANHKFDTIFSSNLLEHLTRNELNQLFFDCFELLKPGGQLIIFMPNYRLASDVYFDDYTHITPISDRSLADWLKAFNFEIAFSHPGYMPYSIRDSKLPARSWLVQLWLACPLKMGGKQMLIAARKPLT